MGGGRVGGGGRGAGGGRGSRREGRGGESSPGNLKSLTLPLPLPYPPPTPQADPTKLSRRKRNERIEPLYDRYNDPNMWRLSRRKG